jgi:hypothetical protein
VRVIVWPQVSPSGDVLYWVAVGYKTKYGGEGTTKEEAVARLWEAVNGDNQASIQ